MSTGEAAGPIHPVSTPRIGHRYLFYVKHHGGDWNSSRWSVDRDQEFAVFDSADLHDLSDDGGSLYVIGRNDEEQILALGRKGQQLAKFPFARPGEHWHGYPPWPLKEYGLENLRGDRHPPAKEVFLKMEAAKLISPRQRKRLYKGNHI